MIKAIGLSGWGLVGKTEAAKYVELKYGFRRRHIATSLRKMLASLLEDFGYSPEDIYDILEGSRKDGWIIPELGVDSRHLQVSIGTAWGRECVHPDIWVRAWSYSIQPGERVLNDSVRFPNEEDGIQESGGFTILIRRMGSKPAKFLDKQSEVHWNMNPPDLDYSHSAWQGVHPSERIDLLAPNYIINNDGSLGDLYTCIDEIMAEHQIIPTVFA